MIFKQKRKYILTNVPVIAPPKLSPKQKDKWWKHFKIKYKQIKRKYKDTLSHREQILFAYSETNKELNYGEYYEKQN